MDSRYENSYEKTHVLPIMVMLTDEEWERLQEFFPNMLYIHCERADIMDETKSNTTTTFGDMFRWLFKLDPSYREVFRIG